MGAEALECTKVPLKTCASGGRCGEPMAAAAAGGRASGTPRGSLRCASAEAVGSCQPTGCRPSVRPGGGFLEVSPFPHPLVTFSSGTGFGGGRAGGRAAPLPFPRCRRAAGARGRLGRSRKERGVPPTPNRRSPTPTARPCRRDGCAASYNRRERLEQCLGGCGSRQLPWKW